jgi:hypothetical protein
VQIKRKKKLPGGGMWTGGPNRGSKMKGAKRPKEQPGSRFFSYPRTFVYICKSGTSFFVLRAG